MYNNFLDFLKLVVNIELDCSFPMSRYPPKTSLWFESYGILKISATYKTGSQPLSVHQNRLKLPKSAIICL